jgi:hypothetical protein
MELCQTDGVLRLFSTINRTSLCLKLCPIPACTVPHNLSRCFGSTERAIL